MTKIFAVVGKPVLHSRSPQMMNAVFHELGVDAVYTRLAAETAVEALETANAIGISGLNVTTPFKEEMARIVEMDEIAKKLGAVNTIVFRNGKAHGTNTDVDGVVGALSAHDIRGRNAVVLGAGGAAKAATAGLVSLGINVTVVNRTVEKAEAIANMLDCGYAPLSKLETLLEHDSVVVSALSTYERVVPSELLKKDMIILDANYAKESQLIKDGKTTGCRTIDGKEWLAHHGVKVCELFTGRKVQYKKVRDAIESKTKKPANIALVGMMGSGKTVNAQELAERTGMGIVDTDREIENENKKTIRKIFQELGEEKFREIEARQIVNVDGLTNKIISCGGGAILRQQNIEIIRKNAATFWLWASPKTIEKRVEGGERPLLNVADRRAEIVKLLEKRKALYSEAADCIIATDDKTPEKIVEVILYENQSWQN